MHKKYIRWLNSNFIVQLKILQCKVLSIGLQIYFIVVVNRLQQSAWDLSVSFIYTSCVLPSPLIQFLGNLSFPLLISFINPFPLQSYPSIMLKKKDRLYDCLKKNSQIIQKFLDIHAVINLSLASKKLYILANPFITSFKLDHQSQNIKSHTKTNPTKNKNKAQKYPELKSQQVQVDISRVLVNKARQKIQEAKWERIYEIPFNNSYLQKKLESGVNFFYKNTKNNRIIYVNRSLVDPNLNYYSGGFNQDLQDEFKNKMYQEMVEGDISDIDFTSPEALRNRQKQILENIEKQKEKIKKLEDIDFQQQLIKGVKCKKIALILCFGGSFSFGIFQQGRCILHKSDKKYVCRKKAGERQLNRDKQSGSQIQSMGSQIRRDQQKKHIANVGQILAENKQSIESCDLVFLQAPGLNRLFIINDVQTLSGVKDKLRSVCLTAKKANYTEVQVLYNQITKINFVNFKGEEKND